MSALWRFLVVCVIACSLPQQSWQQDAVEAQDTAEFVAAASNQQVQSILIRGMIAAYIVYRGLLAAVCCR